MTPLTDFFPSPVTSLASEAFLPWIPNSQWIIPHPKPLLSPLLLPHDTQIAGRFDPVVPAEPHCFWIPCPLLTPPFPKKSTPYQISPRQWIHDSFALSSCTTNPICFSPLPDGTLSVTQPKSISTLLKPVLKSSPDSLVSCPLVFQQSEARSLQAYQFQTSLCGKLQAMNVLLPAFTTLWFSARACSLHPQGTYLWETLFQSTRRPIAILSLAFTSVDSRAQIKNRMACRSLENKERKRDHFQNRSGQNTNGHLQGICCSLLVCRTPQPPNWLEQWKQTREASHLSAALMSELWGKLAAEIQPALLGSSLFAQWVPSGYSSGF